MRASGLELAPPLLLVGVTGLVADRFDRRKLLFVTQGSLMVLGLTIGVLLLLGAMNLWTMYAFAFALGVVAAFDNPTRQAFVSDLVARENASNAVALNAASFNTARMIVFMVAGEKKADTLAEVLSDMHRPDPAQYPAQRIDPRDGKLIWLVDEAAASKLPD